jgi:hypothetical protein
MGDLGSYLKLPPSLVVNVRTWDARLRWRAPDASRQCRRARKATQRTRNGDDRGHDATARNSFRGVLTKHDDAHSEGQSNLCCGLTDMTCLASETPAAAITGESGFAELRSRPGVGRVLCPRVNLDEIWMKDRIRPSGASGWSFPGCLPRFGDFQLACAQAVRLWWQAQSRRPGPP